MPSSVARRAILRMIQSHIEEAGCPTQVTLENEKGRFTIHFARNEVITSRSWSPLEKAILSHLSDGEWKTSHELARLTGYSRSGQFNSILSNLAETGAVEASTRYGYRIPPSQPEAVTQQIKEEKEEV